MILKSRLPKAGPLTHCQSLTIVFPVQFQGTEQILACSYSEQDGGTGGPETKTNYCIVFLV